MKSNLSTVKKSYTLTYSTEKNRAEKCHSGGTETQISTQSATCPDHLCVKQGAIFGRDSAHCLSAEPHSHIHCI